MGCLTDDTLLAHFEGALSAREAVEVDAHLSTCATCARLLSRLRRAMGSYDSLTGQPPRPQDAEGTNMAGLRLADTLASRLLGSLDRKGSQEEGSEPEVLRAGQTVGHFQVIRLIGCGGMGEVYLARDERLGRKVALKLLHQAAVASSGSLEDLLREARTTALFSHPHIVTVYEVGEERGRPYLALEYLQGQTLRQRMSRQRLNRREILRVVRDMAEALREAHENGVLHLDLKPSNIILAGDGRLRVLDFGLARLVEGTRPVEGGGAGSEDDASPEDARRVRGSPGYMAPEQWMARETSGAADVWALGVILYELLAGVRPHHGADALKLAALVCSAAPAPTLPLELAVPEDLAGMVAACLDKDPSARPTAPELLDRIERLLASEAGEQPLASPFRGLLPFEEGHNPLFFGRDEEISIFVRRMEDEPVLPVTGVSGAGKSSFVQAGVIPRLKEQGRYIVLRMRPGRRPLRTLARRVQLAWRGVVDLDRGSSTQAAGMGPTARDAEDLANRLSSAPALLNMELQRLAEVARASVLLFVDQLEEVYGPDEPDSADAFVAAVCGAADDAALPVRVIFTLREEFISRLAANPLARAALGRITVLRPAGRPMLQEVLIRPVVAVGHAYDDPTLVEEMAAAVEGEAASLPLLQFAGLQLWERRDARNRLLLRSAYQEMGGVGGALARHADGVLAAMSADDQLLARAVLLRLVSPEGTRRVAPVSQVLEGLPGASNQVLPRLLAGRILVERRREDPSDEAEADLELVHESLVMSWEKLRRWLDEGKEELAFLGEAERAADLWRQRGRRNNEVWTGEALKEARRILGRGAASSVPARVEDFIAAGEAEEVGRQRRRRLRWGVAVTLLALVTIGSQVAALVVRAQRNLAEQHRAEALLESARAASRGDDPLEARARVRTALEAKDSATARMLWWELDAEPMTWRRKVGAVLHRASFAPDGKSVALGGSDKVVTILDSRTGQVIKRLRGPRDQVLSVAHAPDGKWIASGGRDGVIWLWEGGEAQGHRLTGGHKGAIWDLDFSPDGKRLASAGNDGKVLLHNLDKGGEPLRIRGAEGALHAVRMVPNGKSVVAAGTSGAIYSWDLASGKMSLLGSGSRPGVHALAFSPGGESLALGGDGKVVRILASQTGQETRIIRGHTRAVWALAFSPDGKTLASAGKDNTIQLRPLTGSGETRTFRDHRSMVLGLAFSPDGEHLLSTSADRSARLWRVNGKARTTSNRGHGAIVPGAAFSSNGKILASCGRDGMIRIWNVESGTQRAVYRPGGGKLNAVVFSPDGAWLATAGTGHTVHLFQASTGTEKQIFRGHTDKIFSLAFTPDGKTLASASEDGTARLWDIASGNPGPVLHGHTSAVHGLTISSDGTLLATGSRDRSVRIWTLPDGEATGILRGHSAPVWGVAFSPRSSGELYSSSLDGLLRRWRLPDGEVEVVGRCAGRAYWPAVSPDGARVGVPCSDGLGRVWDGAGLTKLEGHSGEVNSLSFSPREALAATTGDDGTVRLWELKSGRPYWHTPLLAVTGRSPILCSRRGCREPGGLIGPPQGSARWQIRIRQAALDAHLPGPGAPLCLLTFDGGVEQWDTISDERVLEGSARGGRRILSSAGGCVTLGGGRATLHRPGKPLKVLAREGASAGAPTARGLLLAAGGGLQVISSAWAVTRTYPIPGGATTLAWIHGSIALGYPDGSVEILDEASGARRASFNLEGAPASPVTALAGGVAGTLAVGHANGEVALHMITNGRRLRGSRLHGPARHLLMHKERLIAATSLEDSQTWDLSKLTAGYCQVLQDVWRRVPVIWKDGLPTVSPPPSGHACAPKR